MTNGQGGGPMTAAPFGPWVGGGFAPLSGPVVQMFDFWRDWVANVGQIGLVNIDLGNAGDHALERKILDEAGSYGRQIGQLSDALDAVIAATCEGPDGELKPELTDAQREAIFKFRALREQVEAAKASGA
ncbi:MAG: hypothetical protein AAF183_19580 [Pseudomonadota bacterium]